MGLLTTLDLSANQLTSFDGSGLTALTSLTVNSNTLLPSLSFTNGKLTTFGGQGMTGLLSLDLHGNLLTTFGVYL